MNRSAPALATVFMALIAVTAPLQVFAFVPGVNLYAPTLLAILGFGAAVLHAFSLARFRMPFELAIPWVALVACALGLAVNGTTGAWIVVAAAFAFAIPIQIRPTREHVIALLRLNVAASAAMAVVTLVGWTQQWMPTAYVLESGANVHFAHTVAGGAVTLLTGMVIALGLTLAPNTHIAARILWAVAAIVQGGAAATASIGLGVTPSPQIVPHGPFGMLFAILLLYAVARILAKVLVDIEERPTIFHVVLVVDIGIVALATIATAPNIPVASAFLAGLACAYALPASDTPTGRIAVAIAPALTLLLFTINATHVHQTSPSDARNYDVAVADDLAARDFGTLHRRLDLIERLAPNERRTHWWRARGLLAQGRPMRAVTEFAASLDEPGDVLLPPPNEDERELFLRELRDTESAAENPDRHYAYARALVAAGNPSEALAAVRLHAERDATPNADLDPEPLAEAVAFLLGDRTLASGLASWPAGMLVATLQHWGAAMVNAPPWFPGDHLPAVFAGQMRLDTTAILVAFPGDSDYQEQPFDVNPRPLDETDSYWTPIFGDERKWVIEWIAPAQGRGPARITGRAATWDLLTYRTTLNAIPEQPAITVWMP